MCRNIPYTSERLPITHIKISVSHWAKLDEEVLPAALSYQHDASAREVIGSTNLGMYGGSLSRAWIVSDGCVRCSTLGYY